jgi:hypothetical protein
MTPDERERLVRVEEHGAQTKDNVRALRREVSDMGMDVRKLLTLATTGRAAIRTLWAIGGILGTIAAIVATIKIWFTP